MRLCDCAIEISNLYLKLAIYIKKLVIYTKKLVFITFCFKKTLYKSIVLIIFLFISLVHLVWLIHLWDCQDLPSFKFEILMLKVTCFRQPQKFNRLVMENASRNQGMSRLAKRKMRRQSGTIIKGFAKHLPLNLMAYTLLLFPVLQLDKLAVEDVHHDIGQYRRFFWGCAGIQRNSIFNSVE